MKKTIFFITTLCLLVISCTKEKTDYEAEIDTVVTEHYEFKEAAAINSEGHHISIEALNGTFYKGYNEIRLKISGANTNENINAPAVTFLPVMTNADGSRASCPHRYNLVYNADDKYFPGYAVFTSESGTNETWELYISFAINDQTYSVKQTLLFRSKPTKT